MLKISSFFAILAFTMAGWHIVLNTSSEVSKPEKNKGPRPEIISVEAAGDTVMLFTVKTVTYGGLYAPSHVMAIWITNSSNAFVRSLKVMATTQKNKLYTWNSQSSGNVTNAITGATLSNHQTHTVAWNGKNSSGTLVADGTYKVWVEFNETNNTGNPLTTVWFNKGTNQHLTPSNTTYFQNMDLQVFTASAIGELGSEQASVVISPNPVTDYASIEINLDQASDVNIQIVSADGKVVHNYNKAKYPAGKHVFFWYPFDSDEGHSGLYFVKVSINNTIKTFKIFLKE